MPRAMRPRVPPYMSPIPMFSQYHFPTSYIPASPCPIVPLPHPHIESLCAPTSPQCPHVPTSPIPAPHVPHSHTHVHHIPGFPGPKAPVTAPRTLLSPHPPSPHPASPCSHAPHPASFASPAHGRHGNGDGAARLFHVLVTDKAGCCVPAARHMGAVLTVTLPYVEGFS